MTLAAAAGCAALMGRPFLTFWWADPSAALTVVFVALLAAGLVFGPPARPVVTGRLVAGVALAVGVGAFGLGRVIGGLPSIAPVSGRYIVLNTLAAVAEEAFFRRFLYGVIEATAGAGAALAATSVLFAMVHLMVYGAGVLPLDLAAGLLLGWQRRVTGSWGVPAVTHIVANVLMVVR